MKKQTIWILTILMAFTFIGLLCIQIFYMKNIVGIRYEQFSQGVRQSLIAVAQHLERDETRYFLEDQVNLVESQSIYAKRLGSSLPTQEGLKVSFAHRLLKPTLRSGAMYPPCPRFRPENLLWVSTSKPCRMYTAITICISEVCSTM